MGSLMSTVLLLYKYSNVLKTSVAAMFDLPSKFNFHVVVGFEHLILVGMILAKFVIPDIPVELLKLVGQQKEIDSKIRPNVDDNYKAKLAEKDEIIKKQQELLKKYKDSRLSALEIIQ